MTTPKRQPAHILAHIAELKEAGLRQAKAHTCPRCSAECLRGDDHDKSAMVAVVDLAPLDHVSEMVAVLAGLATYTVTAATGKAAKPNALELNYRDVDQWSTTERRGPVLKQHRCARRKKETLW